MPKNTNTEKQVKRTKDVQSIIDTLTGYGYTENELLVDDEEEVVNVSGLIIISLQKEKRKKTWTISFSSSAVAIGAAQLIDYLHSNGVKKIIFFENFFITTEQNEEKIFYGNEADMKYQNELKQRVIAEFVNDKQADFLLANHDGLVH